MPLTANERIRNIISRQRTEEECGWNVTIKPLVWWRENHPGSSSREGRMRKEGEKRGRKRKHA
jgi:hypothetical protein